MKKLDNRQVIEHYEKTKSATQTARHFGTTRKRIARITKNAGVYVPRTIKLPKEEEEEIISKWKNGTSQLQISKDHNLSQTWVGRFLRKKGVITKPMMPSRENHSGWKGGRIIDNNGYARILLPLDSPYLEMAMSDGYVAEHRYVMAKHLGRCLTKNETVHHINGNRTDNRIENLQLRKGKHGKGITYCCGDCGSHNIVPTDL